VKTCQVSSHMCHVGSADRNLDVTREADVGQRKESQSYAESEE
jgi:hypothetical protein